MEKEITDEKIAKKMKEGWIKSLMMIEVMAVSKEFAESALKKHIEKMEKEKKTIIYKKDFKETNKVKKPFPNIDVAYSQIVELELITETYEQLVVLAMNYGPSSIEILEPEHIKIDMGEAQGILNSIADVIHKFAARGSGGIIINT